MSKDTLKTGREILDDYFKEMARNQNLDQDQRSVIVELWEQNRLYTRTHISRALDAIREKKSK